MNSARLYVYGPIPAPSDWVLAPEESAPPGHIKLCSLSISRRTAAKNPGSDVVMHEVIEALPAQVERLLRAYARLDAAGRAEVLRMAEQLAASSKTMIEVTTP